MLLFKHASLRVMPYFVHVVVHSDNYYKKYSFKSFRNHASLLVLHFTSLMCNVSTNMVHVLTDTEYFYFAQGKIRLSMIQHNDQDAANRWSVYTKQFDGASSPNCSVVHRTHIHLACWTDVSHSFVCHSDVEVV